MITKIINYLKYKFTPGITVAIIRGDVKLFYSDMGWESYKCYTIYLKENEYGRRYWKCEGYYSKRKTIKYNSTYSIVSNWLNGYNYADIPSYEQITKNKLNFKIIDRYWPK